MYRYLQSLIPFLFAVLFLVPQNTYGQLFFNGQADKAQNVRVLDESRKIFKFPWAGGMNSCQFGQVDMNMDGIKDLFVFDRHGDRIMTFVNGGT